MSYQPEERYWTDYLRIALPVVGLLLMLGLFWFWAASLIGDEDDDNPNDLAAIATATVAPSRHLHLRLRPKPRETSPAKRSSPPLTAGKKRSPRTAPREILLRTRIQPLLTQRMLKRVMKTTRMQRIHAIWRLLSG